MVQITQDADGLVRFSIGSLAKGAWTHNSPLSCPDGFAPTIINFDLPGGIPTTMYGDADFIGTAWPSAWGNCVLLCKRKVAGSDPVTILGGVGGYVGYWTGSAWAELRNSLSTAGVLWSWRQYGTDLFMTNINDGIYRYDGDTLVPVGAKPIAQMESDEAALWSGETADTTNYREGAQSFYAESSGAQTNMVYTPSSNFNAVTGRLSAISYETDKSPGTDFYHFKVMFSNTGTIDTTNTRVLLTDGDGDTLNFPYTTWDSDRSGTALTNPPVASTWYDVYLPALDGTDSATFDATNIDTFTFSVDTSAGTLRMNIDDLYVQYDSTMPNVAYIAEWKNMLVGARTTANPDTYFFSKVSAPDQYSSTANNPIKARGEAITALANHYNQLVIGADHSVHSLSVASITGTYPAYLFDIQEVTDEAGISSHHSVVKGRNRLWWVYQREIVTYNGTGVTKESYSVDVTVAAIDDANLDYAVGAKSRKLNQLWWTYRRSGQSVNDRIMRYDQVHGAWLPCEGISSPVMLQTTSSGVEWLLTVNNTTRKVKRQGDSASLAFSGTNVAGTLEFPPMTVSVALDWVEAYGQYLSNTGSITVAARVADHLRALAGTSYTTVETVNQAAAGELGEWRIGDRGTVCQVRITTDGVRTQIQPPLVVTAMPLSPGQRFV